MKIYCNDCKYYKKRNFYRASECLSPGNYHHVDTYLKRYIKHRFPFEINIDNNCKWFERK